MGPAEGAGRRVGGWGAQRQGLQRSGGDPSGGSVGTRRGWSTVPSRTGATGTGDSPTALPYTAPLAPRCFPNPAGNPGPPTPLTWGCHGQGLLGRAELQLRSVGQQGGAGTGAPVSGARPPQHRLGRERVSTRSGWAGGVGTSGGAPQTLTFLARGLLGAEALL